MLDEKALKNLFDSESENDSDEQSDIRLNKLQILSKLSKEEKLEKKVMYLKLKN